MIEGRAIAALRRGRGEEARRALTRAIELAATIPNVMGNRLRRRLDEARESLSDRDDLMGHHS